MYAIYHRMPTSKAKDCDGVVTGNLARAENCTRQKLHGFNPESSRFDIIRVSASGEEFEYLVRNIPNLPYFAPLKSCTWTGDLAKLVVYALYWQYMDIFDKSNLARPE